LQGTWHAVSGERDGSAIPADMIAEVNFALRFEGDRVTVRVAQPKETKATEKEGGFTIDPRKTLATLDLIDAIDGKTIFCVYRFTADALQICGSRKERPSDFSTKLGSERMLFVLKRGERALPKAFEEPGWVQLFNGKDLSGWKGDAPPWKWENRTLVARTGAPEAGVGARKVLRLRSEVKFKDFELRFEARRLDGFGRLHIRQQPSQETNHIQVHVGEGWGSVRPVAAVDEKVNEQLMEVARKGFKQEEYNKVSVLCRGKRVVVMVNGVTTYDGETLGPQEAGFVEWVTGWDSSVYFRNIEVKELPPEEPGWVQLFNGKDLTGWKTHPKQPEGWKVDKDGVLVGSGPYISHLFTGRDDFTDFHLRAQVKINDQGNSGIYFRIPFDVARGGMFPTGYEAQILNGLQFNPGQKSVEEFLTGSLYGLAPFDKRLVLPDTWFALEVIAKGNHIVIKVNDEKTVDYLDPQSKHTRGHLALQLISHSAPIPQPTVVHFKKIEIKELPPEEPGWVQLFNGKDLTGWVPVARKKEFDPKEVFHVNDNVLIVEGRKEHALLRTVKAYENYELEFEFRVPPLQTQTAGCLLFLHLQPDNTLGNLLSIDPNGEGFLIGPDRKDFEIKIKGKPPRDGGWSRIHLTCKGHEIGVRLNGEDLGIAKEKNSDLRKGFIAILPELNEVHYRNLRLRELKKAEIKEAVPSSSLMHGQSRVGAEADWLAAFKASERPRRKVGRLGGDQQHRLGDAHLG
jgi:uncharacterized protein (TIGR03067 family)